MFAVVEVCHCDAECGARERERYQEGKRERERERDTVTKESVILPSAVSQDTEGNKINLFLFCSGLKFASYRS